MRKITVLSFITLDGVMQAPGGPEEDRSGGFEFGGWTAPFGDEAPAESTVTPSGVIFANYKRAGEVKTGTVGA